MGDIMKTQTVSLRIPVDVIDRIKRQMTPEMSSFNRLAVIYMIRQIEIEEIIIKRLKVAKSKENQEKFLN